jgi:Ser/Thr protein kinase RdoA (MazF antagonist)
MEINLSPVLSVYGLKPAACEVEPLGSGLINHTWIVRSNGRAFILQRINDAVFKHPEDIEANIHLIGAFLRQHHPGYLFTGPLATGDGREMIRSAQGCFRMFPFIAGSHTVAVVHHPGQAWEAARQFGLFTRQLSGFPAGKLKCTLPDFHNLSLRYQQFRQALETGNPERLRKAAGWIGKAEAQQSIAGEYEKLKTDPGFRIRVTHHDTKISNVLFDGADKGLCVIDLDTVMPGYFISDVGDMMRTYLPPVSEEEKDFSELTVREEFFRAIVSGYLHEMRDELTAVEKNHFVYAGKFMIYMQALRFLTDFLHNDKYYGARYEGHNLVRAGNQFTLLGRLLEKEGLLTAIQEEESRAAAR